MSDEREVEAVARAIRTLRHSTHEQQARAAIAAYERVRAEREIEEIEGTGSIVMPEPKLKRVRLKLRNVARAKLSPIDVE